MATSRQDTPPPFDRRGFRVKNASVDTGDVQRNWPMRPQRPAPGVADQEARFSPKVWDTGIMRDNTPWFGRTNYIAAGRGVASWAEYPDRPILNHRSVTVNRRVGTSQTRHLLDPRTGTTGLHSQVYGGQSGYHTQATGANHPSTTVRRYADPSIGTMSRRRQNRLSPARYDGQSFSQTTQVQGGSR